MAVFCSAVGIPAQQSSTGVLVAPAEGQPTESVRVRIPSHGAAMVGHFHVGSGPEPRHTVLLFPGFASRGQEVLGLGAALSGGGLNVVMFAPRGWHDSEGDFTATGAIEDAQAAFDWLHRDDVVGRFGVDTTRITVGGYSFGAATVLAFVAREPRVRRVFSIAAADHLAMAQHDEYRTLVNAALAAVWGQGGPVRPAGTAGPHDPAGLWQEVRQSPELFSLPLLAPALHDRSVLLVSGLYDGDPPMPQLEHMHLPLYRALRAAGATDVGFRLFMDEHAFTSSRAELAEALLGWLRACEAGVPCGG